MHRNQSVSAHSFAMVPRADIPRSRFNVQTSHKTTFDAGKLVPIYVDEVLPGDTFSLYVVGEFDLSAGCVVNRDPRVLIHGRDILTFPVDAPYGGTTAK